MSKVTIHDIPRNNGIKKIDGTKCAGLSEEIWFILSSDGNEEGLITKEFSGDAAKMAEELVRLKQIADAQKVQSQIESSESARRKSEIIDENVENFKKLKAASGFGFPESPTERRNVILE